MRKLLAVLLMSTVVLTACNQGGDGGGEDGADPKQILAAAFEALAEAQRQAITLSVASDPESLATVSEGDLTEEQANVILNSSITFQGESAENPADSAIRVLVNVEGTDGVELVFVDGDLYIRADFQGFVDAFELDASALESAAAAAQQQGLDFVQPLLDGEFVKFSGIGELIQQFGGQAGTTPQQEEAIRQFGEAIRQDADVESEGTDDVGEHLVATIPIRDLVQRFVDFASQQGLPASPPPEDEIPEGDLTLDVWVSDGKIVQIELDLTQFGEFAEQQGEENPFEGIDQLALRLGLSDEVDEIAAPEAGAEVTTQELEQLIGSFFGATPPTTEGGGGGEIGGGGADIDCSIYEGLPPETFEGLPQETLDQLEQLCPGVVPGG